MDSDRGRLLYEAALEVATRQADQDADGEGVGAAALANDGAILTGVWVDALVDSACLCAETGPIAEAHRTGRRLTASICVRWTQASGAAVLAACGVCQERLAIFGSEILIGVAERGGLGYRFRSLNELRPSPWWDSVEAEASDA